MAAQRLTEPRRSSTPLFTTQKLVEELRHPHAARRAAAADAARRLMALAADRVMFFEGSRAEVWRDIFDARRLQEEIDRGDPRRRPCDPMRAAGAQLALDALNRLLALRAGDALVEADARMPTDADLERIVERLAGWTSLDAGAIEDAA